MMLSMILAAACAGGTEPSDATDARQIVGGGAVPIEGFGVFGVVVFSDDTSQGYVCGQQDAIDQTRWLSGDADSLTGEGWTATLDGGNVELVGEVGSAGEEVRVEAALEPFGAGGLFEGFPDGCRTGLIAWSGSGGGLQTAGTWCDGVDRFFQVEPVGTIVADVPIVSVRVQTGVEVLEFDLTRLR